MHDICTLLTGQRQLKIPQLDHPDLAKNRSGIQLWLLLEFLCQSPDTEEESYPNQSAVVSNHRVLSHEVGSCLTNCDKIWNHPTKFTNRQKISESIWYLVVFKNDTFEVSVQISVFQVPEGRWSDFPENVNRNSLKISKFRSSLTFFWRHIFSIGQKCLKAGIFLYKIRKRWFRGWSFENPVIIPRRSRCTNSSKEW